MLVRVLCHEYSRSKRRCVTVRQPPILTSPKPISTLLQRFAIRPPSGDRWLHEIKRDGFRVIARKEGKRVKLYSRPGNDLTARFPLIVRPLLGCGHAPASSTGRLWRAVTTRSHPSIASGTSTMTAACSCLPST
jgi:hypothetical protein